MIKFGPAGSSLAFTEAGYKSSVQMPMWLDQLGLDAYEYQCNKGVKISEKLARQLGEEAVKHGIALSVHAPYYINMSSVEEEKRNNSVKYITDTMRAASWMGATKIVVHPGACTGLDRIWCVETAIEVMKKCLAQAKEEGYDHVIISPELMGKENQLGNLEEVIKLSNVDERYVPTIDFGHLNARTQGSLKTKEDFQKVFEQLINGLGEERARKIHSHFSRIEYTEKGEKRHWTFEDEQYGPEYTVFLEAAAAYKMEMTVICESAGTQALDALTMKKYYQQLT